MTYNDRILAGAAFEIVSRSFLNGGSDHRSFRLKNLTKDETLSFLTIWQEESEEKGLQLVRLLVANDSHNDFPSEYRADPERSITYYRNNNDHGLVYVETKVESDEQGLKNIFTLRDVNFLDGSFDGDNFYVPEELVKQAFLTNGSAFTSSYELLKDRLIEVLKELNAAGHTIPVRRFVSFINTASHLIITAGGVHTSEEINHIIGQSLIELDMFPDEQWREHGNKVTRRLYLNMLRADLAASLLVDLDREKISADALRTKFKDIKGTDYESPELEYWQSCCSEYSLYQSDKTRFQIPYRIFEQIFVKDVTGLPLGERISLEIAEKVSSRVSDYSELSVEDGLNSRSSEDAKKFLEAEDPDINVIPLRDLLSKQTRRMVDKLASPVLEKIDNPLLKLSEVASAFRERNSLDEGDYKVVINTANVITSSQMPTLGLFTFLYAKSLNEVSSNYVDSHGTLALEIGNTLLNLQQVPPVRKELDSDSESDNSDTEGNDGLTWEPIKLEFSLVRVDDKKIIDSEIPVEWLPKDFRFLALFWISVCGEDRADINSELWASPTLSGESWVTEVTNRLISLKTQSRATVSACALDDPIFNQLCEIRETFRDEASKEGLSIGLLRNIFDAWESLLADARKTFIPDGDIPDAMKEFLNADLVHGFDVQRVLMLQSHPLKLRWIASYLQKSTELASDALEGTLKVNEQHDSFYLDWIQSLSPHQQPAIQTSHDGKLLFADGERGWTETFQPSASSGGASSGDKIHSKLVNEIVRQITSYLHIHPYKADGLRILVATQSASALAAELVQGLRKAEFKDLSLTIELILPRDLWESAAQKFELVDTNNRLAGEGSLFPPVQLNLHDFDQVKEDPEATLGNLICDISVVPQFLDDQLNIDAKTEDESSINGKFDSLLDDPTYINSGSGASALWVSLRPKTPDVALSNWSTLCVRSDRKSPVASDRPEATEYIDIRINFQNIASFFDSLHRRSHWVITVERHITREQIERLETRPEVLSVRDGVGPGGLFTMLVSSNAGKEFIIDRLMRKLRKISEKIQRGSPNAASEKQLAEAIYKEARDIAPRLTLDALGISRVTEEILGLSIARHLADKEYPISVDSGFSAWISLDEHPEWFPSQHTTRADMLRLTINYNESGLSVQLLVLESKLRSLGYEPHGAEQVSKTRKMFASILPEDVSKDPMDGRLWRDALLSAVDTVSDSAVNIVSREHQKSKNTRSRVSQEIRALFREGNFSKTEVQGLYSICEYSRNKKLDHLVYENDAFVNILKSGGNELLDRLTTSAIKPSAILAGQQRQSESQSTNSEVVVNNKQKGQTPSSEVIISPPMPEDAESAQPLSKIGHLGQNELDRRYQIILDTYGQYGINITRPDAAVEYAIEGPASILFRIRPASGVDPKKLSEKIDALKLAMELEASQKMRFSIDKGYVTIDVPKLDEDRYFVSADVMWNDWKRPETGFQVPLGEDRFGKTIDIDFNSSNSPHLLIAGTTGSGKSEALNTILGGLIKYYSPEEVRLQLIDPKGTELGHLSESEYVDGEIGWDEEDALLILNRAVEEMQGRYLKFKQSKVRSIADYNLQAASKSMIPRWVVVLDEYADLTSEPDAKKSIEACLKRLAQKARAAGIHVIIATQKPDASVISTNLRSNLPAQLALRVKSSTESRVIMDEQGAESLAGKGDAFLKESGILTRVQCAKI